jgi:hypothetical protein
MFITSTNSHLWDCSLYRRSAVQLGRPQHTRRCTTCAATGCAYSCKHNTIPGSVPTNAPDIQMVSTCCYISKQCALLQSPCVSSHCSTTACTRRTALQPTLTSLLTSCRVPCKPMQAHASPRPVLPPPPLLLLAARCSPHSHGRRHLPRNRAGGTVNPAPGAPCPLPHLQSGLLLLLLGCCLADSLWHGSSPAGEPLVHTARACRCCSCQSLVVHR